MGFYYLLHKDIPVAMFELDENDANAKPKRLSLNKSNFEHLPLGAHEIHRMVAGQSHS